MSQSSSAAAAWIHPIVTMIYLTKMVFVMMLTACRSVYQINYDPPLNSSISQIHSIIPFTIQVNFFCCLSSSGTVCDFT